MKLHPLCELFPPLEGEEFDVLVTDICMHGLNEPIVMLGDQVLDGRNRLLACQAAGVEPEYVKFTGSDPAVFVLSKNLHRRHLSPGVAAAIVACAQDWSCAHRRGGTGANQHRSRSATLPISDSSTVGARALIAGVSARLQGMADRVSREDRKLLNAVREGRISLPKAVKLLNLRKTTSAGSQADSVGRETQASLVAGDNVPSVPVELETLVAAEPSLVCELLGKKRPIDLTDSRNQIGRLRFRLGQALVSRRKAQREVRYWRRMALETSRGGGTT